MNIRNIIKQALLWTGSIFHRNHKSKILFYHDIYRTQNYKALDAQVYMGTSLDVFKQHVEVIRKEGFEIVPRITKSEGQVCIMLDDGFRGIYECRQWFYDNQIYPTIFLPVVYIGKEGILTREEILDLQHHGFNFECHSWSHGVLTQWNDQELVRELGNSRKFLSELLGKDVTEICLPVGYYCDHLLHEINKYGYQEVYSSIAGNFDETYDGMRRRNLCQFATSQEVKLILRGGNESIKHRYERMHHVHQGFKVE